MKGFRIKGLLAVGLVAMFALLAGCGGSDDSTTDSSGDFAAAADALCSDLNTQSEAVDQPQAAGDIKAYLDQVNDITADTISKLEDVDVPSDQQDDYDAWIDSLKSQEAITEDAAKADDPNAALQAKQSEYDSLNEKGNQLAAGLGMTTCAEDSSGGGSSGGSSS